MWLLHLAWKMPQHGRNKVFKGKQTPNNLPLLLFDVKMLEEAFDRRFESTRKVRHMYLAFKKPKMGHKNQEPN